MHHDAAAAKGAKRIEHAWHRDVKMRPDVPDGVGRDHLRNVVRRTRHADAIAHVEEPLPSVVREESSDVRRAARGCGR